MRMNLYMEEDRVLNHYRPWFFAAALYNLIWGFLNILFPEKIFDILNLPIPIDLVLWQLTGMFVLVYAPAYFWAGRHPFYHRHIILVAFIGKVIGPLGFGWGLYTGQLPSRFGWIILTNDLIWWPAFFFYFRDLVRITGNFWELVKGE